MMARSMLCVRRLLPVALLAVVLAVPSTARAQEDQRSAARALATEGSTAFKEKRWEDAVRYFTKAEELLHAPPHLMFAAKAHLELKHLVEANDLLLKVKNETLPPNAPPAFQRAQEEAFELLQQIKPRLSYLAVDVKNAGTQPLEIRIDAAKLDAVFRGVPKAVNPGEHKVSAIADGFRAEETTVAVMEGERKAVSLEMKPDASARLTPIAAPAAPAATEAAAAPAPTGGDVQKDQGPAQPAEKPGWLKIAPYAAFGVGAVGVGLGTVFALKSGSNRSDADAKTKEFVADCGTRCSDSDPRAKEIHQLDSDAGSAQTIAIVGFVVGGLGVAGGVTLLVLDVGGSDQPKATASGVTVRPVLGLGSAGVTGTF